MTTLAACTKSTAENASPESLYEQDEHIDMLIYNNTAYVNASELDWVKDLELSSDEKLGEILRTQVTKEFEDFDATILELGNEVYSVKERKDFVLVYSNNTWIPYYAYVEG